MTFHFSWTRNLKIYLLYLLLRPNQRSIISEMLHLPQSCLVQAGPHDSMEHTCPAHMETSPFRCHPITSILHSDIHHPGCGWGRTHQDIPKLKPDHQVSLWWVWTHLEIDDHCKDKDGGNQIHEIGEVLAVEGLSKGSDLVSACGQQMKQCNDGTFKFHPCR